MDCYNQPKKHAVKKNIEETGQIFIYPYGEIGRWLYDTLKNQCGIENITAVDNQADSEHGEIWRVSDLAEIDWESGKYAVFLASSSAEYYTELRRELRQYVRDEYIADFCGNGRLASLVMASKEIYRKGISGNVAEAGVYKGDFAKWLNLLFPDRKLYLFDSFEGFREEQVAEQKDNADQTEEWIHTLKDTSVDLVLDKMVRRDNVVIKKGFVPDTFEGLEDHFAFVNLDMDIYQPTYDALTFFWPRLCGGGYIFVHDFDNWDGIEAAVARFCAEYHAGYFCLTDRMSIVIAKPF